MLPERCTVRPIHSIAVIALAGLVGLSSVSLDGAAAADPASIEQAPLGTIAPRHGLDDLTVLQNVLFQVEESYVDPSRVDYEAMFVAALEAVETGIPVVLFRREGRVLHMEVGQHRVMSEVDRIGSRRDLQGALEQVATQLGSHLSVQDIPGDWDHPYQRVEYAMVNGALSTLDPHSRLLVPEEAREMDIDNDGQYGGIGVTVEERDGRLLVLDVRSGDPGEKAGLRPGDHITRVEGVSTMGVPMIDALHDIRGLPGSQVALEVRRRGQAPMQLSVTRGTIAPDAVRGEWLGDGILYLAIPTFHDDVHAGLRAELSRAVKRYGNLKGVVLDLRGNPGGYLGQAVAVSNAFLSNGTILSTVGVGDRREPPQRAIRPDTEPDYPLAVLVDSDSASASEIVAGALRNNERAVIIGERSFGKGSVQNLWDYPDGSKLKLTVGKYLTPGEISIQAVGIPADIETIPVVVAAGTSEPDIRVAWRDRVLREADLDRRFDRVDANPTDPAYSVRYLVDTAQREADPHTDPQVELARRVLMGAVSPLRSEILAGVAPLVERTHVEQERAIGRALGLYDIDWDDDAVPDGARLEATLEPVVADALVAGEPVALRLTVTNRGEEAVPRLLAVTRSDVRELDGLEWVVGRLAAGESRAVSHTVRLPSGYGRANAEVTVDLVASRTTLSHQTLALEVQPAGQPVLALDWAWQDRGNGDGVAQPGEPFTLVVRVRNSGDGPTRDPFVTLETQPGSPVEIDTPMGRPGTPQRRDGSPCAVETPGFDGHDWIGGGEPVGEPGYDPVVYEPDCEHVIEPGDESVVRLDVRVATARATDTPLVLSFGDAGAYDVGAVDEAHLLEAWSNQHTVWLPARDPATGGAAVPPELTVTAHPRPLVTTPTVTLSGLAHDPDGLAHVQILADGDKVFLDAPARSGAPLTTIPYTATLPLAAGPHRITIVATDREGLVRTETYRVRVGQAAETTARSSEF